jgi:membrane-bound metal-dependent hydrolase YbcI (DUF457 family)
LPRAGTLADGPGRSPFTGRSTLPTPVGHSLAGLAIQLAAGERPLRRHWLAAAALLALANLPDADFLPGYLIGEPRAFHWGPAHSFAAAALVGLCAGLAARARGRRFAPLFALASCAYASHLVMDVLLGPGPVSVGLQLFWPLSNERFIAPFAVFEMLPATLDQFGPIRTLFSRDVLPLIAREIAILVPACLLAALFRLRSNAQTSLVPPERPMSRQGPAECETS